MEHNTLHSYLIDLVDLAEWGWLSDLAKRGKVILLSPNLDLVEVGLALAEDDISQVQQWLADRWIYQPTLEQIDAWDNQASSPKFNSLIVQPFVLAKQC
ncbi:MAG: DUF2288 domain-containing protein [Pseudanabaenaceae cyanobacterium bins.68]|nr:DUF2288 domain-containing protein [Pseudanabaenaceae cyanobacterium bins.68]